MRTQIIKHTINNSRSCKNDTRTPFPRHCVVKFHYPFLKKKYVHIIAIKANGHEMCLLLELKFKITSRNARFCQIDHKRRLAGEKGIFSQSRPKQTAEKRVNATLNFSSFLDCYLRPHVSKKSQIGSSGGTSLNRAKNCIFYFMLGELLLRPRN